jgi:hypothetical protein
VGEIKSVKEHLTGDNNDYVSFRIRLRDQTRITAPIGELGEYAPEIEFESFLTHITTMNPAVELMRQKTGSVLTTVAE